MVQLTKRAKDPNSLTKIEICEILTRMGIGHPSIRSTKRELVSEFKKNKKHLTKRQGEIIAILKQLDVLKKEAKRNKSSTKRKMEESVQKKKIKSKEDASETASSKAIRGASLKASQYARDKQSQLLTQAEETQAPTEELFKEDLSDSEEEQATAQIPKPPLKNHALSKTKSETIPSKMEQTLPKHKAPADKQSAFSVQSEKTPLRRETKQRIVEPSFKPERVIRIESHPETEEIFKTNNAIETNKKETNPETSPLTNTTKQLYTSQMEEKARKYGRLVIVGMTVGVLAIMMVYTLAGEETVEDVSMYSKIHEYVRNKSAKFEQAIYPEKSMLKLKEEEARKAEESVKQAMKDIEKKAKERSERKAKELENRMAEELAAELRAKELAEKKAKEKEQRAKELAEQKAKELAEKKAREEAEKKAKELAEQRRAKEEAEKRAKELAEQKAKEEAEQKAKEEAQRAKKEAEQKAKEEAEKKAKELAEQKAKKLAEQKAKELAEQKAKEESQRAKELAKQKAKEEAEKKAKEEAEKKAKEEAEKKAKEEAEQRAEEEAEQKAKELAEQKAKEEAEKRAKALAEKRAKEEAELKEHEEAELKAKENSSYMLNGTDEIINKENHSTSNRKTQKIEKSSELERNLIETNKNPSKETLSPGSLPVSSLLFKTLHLFLWVIKCIFKVIKIAFCVVLLVFLVLGCVIWVLRIIHLKKVKINDYTEYLIERIHMKSKNVLPIDTIKELREQYPALSNLEWSMLCKKILLNRNIRITKVLRGFKEEPAWIWVGDD